MVRLKVPNSERRLDFQTISIPYGSIKRGKHYQGADFTYISIPYGSIKSAFSFAASLNSLKFQFLMVRLKVCRAGRLVCQCKFQFLMVRLKDQFQVSGTPAGYISIPYGSIKSCNFRHKTKSNLSISIPYGSIKS